jgi:hypothetical protein
MRIKLLHKSILTAASHLSPAPFALSGIIQKGAFLLGWYWPPKIDPMLNVMEPVS